MEFSNEAFIQNHPPEACVSKKILNSGIRSSVLDQGAIAGLSMALVVE